MQDKTILYVNTWTRDDIFKNQTFFLVPSILLYFPLFCAKHTSLEAKQSLLPHLMSHWQCQMPCCPGEVPQAPHCSHPLHIMLQSRKTVYQCYFLFPVFGLLRRCTKKSKQRVTFLFACPKDWLCTLVPEEQAHCKSIMFPVARWMGKVPATCYNPFVMPIAGCYEDVL